MGKEEALRDKVAVVTGAASGIGLAVAQAVAAQGASVVVVDIDSEAGGSAVATIQGRGGRAFFQKTDVSKSKEVQTLVRATLSHYGQLDILVNNAGLQYVAPITEFPDERWQQLIDVMLTGTFLCTKYAVPPMIKQGWGRIINMSSIHGKVASKFKAAYVSAKFGICGLTRVTAIEVAEHGITVNAICPSYVRTPLVENQIASQAAAHGIAKDEVIERIMVADAAIKRLLEPQEIAEVVLFLCSDAAAGITGTDIVIDCGWTAH